MLAPLLMQDMQDDPKLRSGAGLDGMCGKPTCPEMFDEEVLLGKELSQGSAKFQLQFMLNTRLTDEERYPLKLSNLTIAEFDSERGPVLPVHSVNAANQYQSPSVNGKFKLFWAMPHQYELRPFEETVMYIDPAGGGKNGDEMAYAVIKTIGAFVYLYAIGGIPGGYEEEKLLELVRIAKTTGSKTVLIEKNFGNGAHANMIKPMFARENWPVILEEVYETGQKELRIIDTLEPLLTSNRLIVRPQVIEDDYRSTQRYPVEVRPTYRFLHQAAYITRERGCLRHDDRLDALYGAVNWVVERLDFDTKLFIEAKRIKEAVAGVNAWKDPKSRRKWLKDVCISGSGPQGRNSFGNRTSRRNRFK